jgi:hypothetical protein
MKSNKKETVGLFQIREGSIFWENRIFLADSSLRDIYCEGQFMSMERKHGSFFQRRSRSGCGIDIRYPPPSLFAQVYSHLLESSTFVLLLSPLA